MFWATADSHEAVVAAFVAIATLLDLPQKVAQDQSLVIAAVKRWLETHSNWLFIFDNADEPQVINEFLPLQHHGKILLTSRAQVFDSLTVSIPTELEDITSGGRLTCFCSNVLDARTCLQAERDAVEQLAKQLDYLPLALEQAAAYLVAKKSRFQDYLVSYRGHGLALLERAMPVAGKYPKSVATTWLLNVEQVEIENTAAADMLRMSAFLYPDNIPLEVFVDGAAELGSTLSTTLANAKQDPLRLERSLNHSPGTLLSVATLKQNLQYPSPCPRSDQSRMNEATQRVWAERVVSAVSTAFPWIDVSNWPECDRLLPHAQVCAELIDTWGIELDVAARLLNQTGYYLHERTQ